MTHRGGRRRKTGADGGGEGEEAGADDAAGDAPDVPDAPGTPGAPGDELRGGGSGETVTGGHLSADGW
ncbi:hypothetical protein AB0D24_18710 [Streptomyces javensis]|uniref:hypothetical protein n=1 Tax=Streptomyces javensis TaxID=114698 RepID=UPI00340CCD4A